MPTAREKNVHIANEGLVFLWYNRWRYLAKIIILITDTIMLIINFIEGI
jgi:hypothetical protein